MHKISPVLSLDGDPSENLPRGKRNCDMPHRQEASGPVNPSVTFFGLHFVLSFGLFEPARAPVQNGRSRGGVSRRGSW